MLGNVCEFFQNFPFNTLPFVDRGITIRTATVRENGLENGRRILGVFRPQRIEEEGEACLRCYVIFEGVCDFVTTRYKGGRGVKNRNKCVT